MRFEHILVPTDFGEASTSAADLAAEMAARFGAKLTLLHIWTIPTPVYAEALSWPVEEIERAAREALSRERARLDAKRPGTEALLDVGSPWERILHAVESKGIDLIVMGTHGRHGIPRFVLGSVAEKVVRRSPVPVLTVPSTKLAEGAK